MGILPLLALLTTVAASRLLAPLHSLTAQVDQIKQHAEYRPVVIQTRDELEKLALAFNELMLDLQTREQHVCQVDQGGRISWLNFASSPKTAGFAGCVIPVSLF